MSEKIAKVVDSLNLRKEAGNKLTQILKRAVDGNSDIYMNPIAGDSIPDDIFNGWKGIVDQNLEKLNPVLKDLENNQYNKRSPRSQAKGWDDRKASLYESFEKEISEIPNLEIFALGPSRLRPLDTKNALDCLKSSTNSGLPDIEKKARVKPDIAHYTLDTLMKTEFYPCLLFTRTQENYKTRNVWGYSILLTLFEMMFYRPLLEIQRTKPWRSALVSPEAVSAGMTKLIFLAKSEGFKLLSIDFSAYDNSVKKKLQAYAFEMIANCFQSKFRPYINRIRDIFNTVGIVTPDGILSGPHGVPSGSTFTNEVDSIVQFLIAFQKSSGIEFVDLSQVQGDDGVYLVRIASKVIDFFESFGLKVSKEKSFVADNWAVYLQSLYHEDYVDEKGIINGIYPTYRALNRIIYPERFENFEKDGLKGSDYFAIRSITILENCRYHPLFKEFVLYVAKLDKYSLEYSDQGLSIFIKRLASKEGKDVTFREWTYGSDVSGIQSFETSKILREYYGK